VSRNGTVQIHVTQLYAEGYVVDDMC